MSQEEFESVLGELSKLSELVKTSGTEKGIENKIEYLASKIY